MPNKGRTMKFESQVLDFKDSYGPLQKYILVSMPSPPKFVTQNSISHIAQWNLPRLKYNYE